MRIVVLAALAALVLASSASAATLTFACGANLKHTKDAFGNSQCIGTSGKRATATGRILNDAGQGVATAIQFPFKHGGTRTVTSRADGNFTLAFKITYGEQALVSAPANPAVGIAGDTLTSPPHNFFLVSQPKVTLRRLAHNRVELKVISPNPRKDGKFYVADTPVGFDVVKRKKPSSKGKATFNLGRIHRKLRAGFLSSNADLASAEIIFHS